MTVSAAFNTEPETGLRVSQILGDALVESLKVEAIAGKESQSKLPLSALTDTCIGDSACLVEAGKTLNVDELLMLIIVGGVDELKIEATWVDTNSGKTALRQAIVVPLNEIAMAEVFRREAATLIPDAEPREAAAQEGGTQNTATGNGVVKDISSSGNTGTSTGTTATKATSRSFTGLSTALLVGGSAALGGALVYGGIRRLECEGFVDCTGKDRPTLDLVADIGAGLGAASISVALFLYFQSDDERSPAPPIALQSSSNSLSLTYGGQF